MGLSLADELGYEFENTPGASTTRTLHEKPTSHHRNSESGSVEEGGEFLSILVTYKG